MLICLYIVYSCFLAATAKLRSCDRGCVEHPCHLALPLCALQISDKVLTQQCSLPCVLLYSDTLFISAYP